jgi:EpsI family protein
VEPSNSSNDRTVSWPHVLVGLGMVVASGLAVALTPARHAVPEGSVNLEEMIPKVFAGWHEVDTGLIQMDLTPKDGEETTTDRPYDQALMRTYVRNERDVVMLALAYGRTQRQDVKVHRPELCYVAQGFQVEQKRRERVAIGPGVDVMAYRLLTRNQRRTEPVTYWIRIGHRITANAWDSRGSIFLAGLQGEIPDGLLVRVSQPVASEMDAASSYQIQDEFLRDLFRSLDEPGREMLIGKGG